MSDIWSIYKERGFHQQCTDEQALVAKSQEGPLTGYIGFDPTADSFHVGHLIPLMSLVHFQQAGHRPIALVGAGTAMIGDPTGKNEMRKMLTEEELERNIEGLKAQLGGLLDFGDSAEGGSVAGSGDGGEGAGKPDTGAIMVNNAEWLRKLNYIDFLREVGPHFSVNRMLTFETFKMRLEGAGLSFIEFNYPLLQSYDFLELHRRYGCHLQMGGDDQWANIISGVDLTRRLARATVYGWTFPLLTTASGAKMGKTEKGAVWLNPDKTSPFDYFQYWVNLDDADVAKCLRLFTMLPVGEVAELEKLQGADVRKAKQKLAFEATSLIHGAEEAEKAQRGARALFGGSGGGTSAGEGDMTEVPSSAFSAQRLSESPSLAEVLTEVGLTKSRGEARRLMEQGGITVNNQRVSDVHFTLTPDQVTEGAIMLKVGKKKHHRLLVD